MDEVPKDAGVMIVEDKMYVPRERTGDEIFKDIMNILEQMQAQARRIEEEVKDLDPFNPFNFKNLLN